MRPQKGVFDSVSLKKRNQEIDDELKSENIWSNQELSSKLLKEQKEIKSKLEKLSLWNGVLEDS